MSSHFFFKTAAALVCAVVLFLGVRSLSALLLFSLAGRGIALWPGVIRIAAEKNFLFAFGLPLSPWLSLSVGGCGLLLVTYCFLRSDFRRTSFLVGYALIVAGGLSNFFERLRTGYVWDYLVVEIGGLRGVWNLADLLILAGIGLWAAGWLRARYHFGQYGD